MSGVRLSIGVTACLLSIPLLPRLAALHAQGHRAEVVGIVVLCALAFALAWPWDRARLPGTTARNYRHGAGAGILVGLTIVPITVLAVWQSSTEAAAQDHLQFLYAMALLMSLGALPLLALAAPPARALRVAPPVPLPQPPRRGVQAMFAGVAVLTMLFLRYQSILEAVNTTVIALGMAIQTAALYLVITLLKQSFTLGEIFLLTQSLALFFLDAIFFLQTPTFRRALVSRFLPEALGKLVIPPFRRIRSSSSWRWVTAPGHVNLDRSPLTILLQVFLFGMLLVGLVAFPVLWWARHSLRDGWPAYVAAQRPTAPAASGLADVAARPHGAKLPSPRGRATDESAAKAPSLLFYLCLLAMALLAFEPYLHVSIGHMPLVWLYEFVTDAPLRRLGLLAWWACVLLVALPAFYVYLERRIAQTVESTAAVAAAPGAPVVSAPSRAMPAAKSSGARAGSPAATRRLRVPSADRDRDGHETPRSGSPWSPRKSRHSRSRSRSRSQQRPPSRSRSATRAEDPPRMYRSGWRRLRVTATQLNLHRKFFHGLALALFIPGYLIDPALMHLAFSVALSALLCIEYVRFFRLWPFGPAIERFTSQFLDSKDTGPFLTSHLYLLVGCALPVWLESVANGAVMPTLAGCAGMLCLGVSDTLASVVGFLVGRHRWPASSKTIEGSLAFWLSGWAAALLLQRLVADYVPDAAGLAHVNLAPGGLDGLPTMPASAPWLGVVFAAAALLEACCDQNDNLVLPLYVYTILTRPLISQ